jgi:hypothetical protein
VSPAPAATPLTAAIRSASATFPTLAEIKVALGIDPTDTSKDAAITQGMAATIAMIESYLGRGIAYDPAAVQTFEPIDTRDPKLFLDRFPVESVASVVIDGGAVTGWRLYARQGVIDLGRGCCRGPRDCCDAEPVIVVTYAAGYQDDAWPPDLLEAVLRAFYGRWNASGGSYANATAGAGSVKSWSADGLSISMNDAASSSGMGDSSKDVIPPDLQGVAAMLDPYRVRFVRGV